MYDGNGVDLDASKDTDFSLESCSKSKKKSTKKVQILHIHIYAEVSFILLLRNKRETMLFFNKKETQLLLSAFYFLNK